jgi:hypothetical protein
MDDEQQPFGPGNEFSWLTKLLIRIAAADEETLRQCPRRDVINVCAIAWLMLGALAYQTGLFSVVGHMLFASPGEIRPEIIIAAFAIALFIMGIDRYIIVICGYHSEGLKELARAGIDIRGSLPIRIKAGLFLVIRIFVLAVGLAQITALFVSLIWFAADIHARIDKKDLIANASLISQATNLVDGEIQRETDAVNAQSARVAALSAQVQNLRQNVIDPAASDRASQLAEQEVQQLLQQQTAAENDLKEAESFATSEAAGLKHAPGNSGVEGFGPRYRAAEEQVADAKARLLQIETSLNAARGRLDGLRNKMSSANQQVLQRSQGQLPSFKADLKAETERLTALKNDLGKLIAGRELAIRRAVENAPGHVPYDDGFLAQLRTLEEIAHEDRKIGLVILLIEIVSLGFELAMVLAKVFGYAPTVYAALVSSDHYRRVVKIVDDLTAELNEGEPPDEPATSTPIDPDDPAPDSGGAATPVPVESANALAPPAEPPKRGRGRPRIHPVETHPPRKRNPPKHPPLTVITGGIGQEPQGQPPEQPAPA